MSLSSPTGWKFPAPTATAFLLALLAFFPIEQKMNKMSAEARKTFYVVQSFSRQKRGALKAETPIQAASSDAAIRRAGRLAETKAGVLAFAQTGDPAMGDFDEPVILARHGDTPSDD